MFLAGSAIVGKSATQASDAILVPLGLLDPYLASFGMSRQCKTLGKIRVNVTQVNTIRQMAVAVLVRPISLRNRS